MSFRKCARRFQECDAVQQMLLTDICLQLPSQFLAKVDRATMAHGLEVRVPLLDEKLAKLAISLPSRYKVRGAQKKIVLRHAMRDVLPAEVLDGPKTGFGVPYEHWLRTALYGAARRALLGNGFVERFGFNELRIKEALEEHRTGQRQHGFLLWKLFQLALWTQEYA
jgi:asparagine synthase (glutamine-hydrolysing)